MKIELAPTYIGGQYVTVRDHGRLWAVTEMTDPHNLRVQVGDRYHHLRTVHDGFSPITGAALLAYVLGDEA